MKLLTRIAVTAVALLLVSHLVPGVVITSLSAALIAAVVLGVLNALVRPILVVLTFPITILSLGLFIFIINGLLFAVTASFVAGFSVTSFGSAVLGAILVSIISTIGNRFV